VAPVIGTTPAAAAPEPTPTSTGSIGDDIADAGQDAWAGFWDWFTGWPLEVLIILVVGAVLLALLRRAIAHVTERIATGRTKEPESSWRDWFRRSRVVEEAIVLANPLATARRSQRARTVGSVLRSSSNVVVGTIMALMILQSFDINVGPLLASAGVAGVAIGFGAQSLVKDFISGVFILMEDQFGVGDVVDLGSGAEGTVEEVQLRVTQVRSFDGTLWYVRNGEILRAGNRTQQWSRAIAELRVPVESDVDAVRAALGRATDAVHDDEALAGHFLEAPSVRGVDAVNDFTMTFTLHAQVRPGTQWEVSRALLRAAQAELVAAGVLKGDVADAEKAAVRAVDAEAE
jgi:small conductance mechanosensitive channel